MNPSCNALRTVLCVLSFASIGLGQQAAAPPVASPAAPSVRAEIEELRRKLESLEHELEQGRAPGGSRVDLTDVQVSPSPKVNDQAPLSRRWFENLEVWGFGAFSYLDTGSAGSRPDGGFLVQEASIFLEAEAWEQTFLHFEIQAAPLGVGASESIGIGELYGDLRELWGDAQDQRVGLKAGRFYIPFGEEYTWTHATDNPLISNSAPYAYGFAQGLQLYGIDGKLGWMVAVTDGAEEHDAGDHLAKALNLKAWGNLSEALYLSASVMANGDTDKTAIEFGGSNLTPVGSGGAPSAGASPSSEISAQLYELDARWQIGHGTGLGLAFGQCKVDDEVNAFDRSLTWFRIEPRHDFSAQFFADARFSEIGTYDSDKGYQFDGEILAEGNDAFGYDTQRFQRLSLGLGWQPNPHTLVKLEGGRDRFWLIDASPISATDENRTYFGAQLVLSF